MIVLWVLYGLQCVAWLPGGGVNFVRPVSSWIATEGPGWRLSHVLPSAETLRATRFPLLERDGRLWARGGTTWWASSGMGSAGIEVSRTALAQATAAGELVKLDGRALARAADDEDASELTTLLRRLATAHTRTDSTRLIESWLARRFSIETLRERHSRVRDATRWLGRVSDLYFVTAFALLPMAFWWLGPERALFLAAPAFLALHLLVLFLFARAHRRLRSDGRGAFAEAVLSAALYPPLLLRARHDLVTRVTGSFHPAVVAALVLPDDARDDLLRRELMRARRDADKACAEFSETTATGRPSNAKLGIAACELAQLRALGEKLGSPEEKLMAPPTRSDPKALSYCPACHGEYRRREGECIECHTALTPFQEETDTERNENEAAQC